MSKYLKGIEFYAELLNRTFWHISDFYHATEKKEILPLDFLLGVRLRNFRKIKLYRNDIKKCYNKGNI